MALQAQSMDASEVIEGEPATRYGRYEIVRKLASGGMGEVYLAKSLGAAGFQKRVVIKQLLPHLVQHAHFVEGLVREAKLLVRLEHPNIVQVLDLGRVGEDYFMAMEFVHGYNLATIAHYCAQKRVTIPAAACGFIALQVLAGLEYAHRMVGPDGTRQNIIHRDVSPQNVLISSEGRVKLTDFGIAKVLNEAEAEVTTSLKGKFRYMAPEAVDGRRIDNRYDLFAVGILLFEALCRRHLFAGRRDVDILAQVRAACVPPIARYHPDVPPTLVAVTERALRREPAGRFQSAEEFAAALRQSIPVTEADAGIELREFVEDLFGRPDFPLNKPKLSELDAVDPDVTRSVILDSRVASPSLRRDAAGARSDLRGMGGRAITLLWAAFLLIAAVVGYLAYALLLRQAPPESRNPVVIKVEKSGRDAAVRAPVVDAGLAADAAAVRPPVKGSKRRPFRPRAVTFTERVGQKTFARAGRELRRCFDRHITAASPEVSLGVTSIIRRDGRVTRVMLKPASAEKTALGKCVKRVALKLRYPRHDRPSVTFHQPLRVKRK